MLIKSRNKLVGDLQNNELYDCDDDAVGRQDYEDHDMIDEEQLDLGMGNKDNAPKKLFNFFNKKSEGNSADLNAKIQQLGFSRDTNVNELAARGVKLSFRDELIRKL